MKKGLIHGDAKIAQSFTIAKAIKEWEAGKYKGSLTTPLKLSARHILLVEESGMVGTVDMAIIVKEAKRAGAQVRFVGEGEQLLPIAAGAPFQAITKQLGEVEKLTTIMRQRHDWQKQATVDVREGRAEQAIHAYEENGCVHVKATRVQAKKALIERWWHDGGDAGALILSGRNCDVDDLNDLAQDKLLAAGKLGKNSLCVGRSRIYEKDKIVFTKRNRALDIDNADFAKVEKIDEAACKVTVTLDSGRSVTFSLADNSDFALGRVVTVHKAQGSTVERTYLLIDETMQDRHLSYVQLSRHREKAEIFVDKATAGEQFERLTARMQQRE